MDDKGFTFFRDVAGYLALVVGAILILKSKIKTDNLKDLRERVDILEKEREYSRTQHVENQKAISNLEGQLKTYKEIPLKDIASSLKIIGDSNSQILTALRDAAIITKDAASGGGLLVKTEHDNPLDVKVN